MRTVKNITDLDIQALIDNELDWEEEKKVREAIKYNSHFLKRYQTLIKQKQTLISWWATKNYKN